MVNSKSTLNSSKLNATIDKIVAEVFDEKIWIGMDLRKICEITYGYIEGEKIKLKGKNIVINNEVFITIGGLDIELFKIADDEGKMHLLKEAYDKFFEVISKKENEIKEGICKLQNIEISGLDIEVLYRRHILIGSLEEKLQLINYNKIGSIYELQKTGININLDKNQRGKIDKQLEEIDINIYGGNIKDNQEEVSLIYNKLIKIVEENKNKLNKEEINRINKYISKIKINKKNIYFKKNKKINLLKDLENIKIERNNYITIFNKLISFYNGMDFKVRINNSIKSISDGPKGFDIPGNKDFETISLARLLKLHAHEHETHNINEYNSQKLIGNIRGAGSTEKDEGLAILMENMLKYGKQILKKDNDGKLIIDKEIMDFNNNFIFLFMGEILKNNELKDFLKIFNKLEKDIMSIENRFLRIKRMNNHGVQHKDCSYTRGLFKAIDLINTNIKSNGKLGISFYDMFLGKVGFDDLRYLREIKEKNIINTIKPMFLSDIILYNNISKTKENYQDYIKNKYPILKIKNIKINSIDIECNKKELIYY